METAEVSDAQLGQIRLGMGAASMGFKRPRGRPRIENPANRRGAARGARQGTIDLAKKLCAEHGRDFAAELERKLRELIEELAGPEALRQILDEMEVEKLAVEERITRLKTRYEELLRQQSAGPPDGVPYEQALERIADRLCAGDNKAEYLALLEPNARKLAQDYHGHHWQTIKRELKARVEEKLGVKSRNSGAE